LNWNPKAEKKQWRLARQFRCGSFQDFFIGRSGGFPQTTKGICSYDHTETSGRALTAAGGNDIYGHHPGIPAGADRGAAQRHPIRVPRRL
jgi:hypothetical protein